MATTSNISSGVKWPNYDIANTSVTKPDDAMGKDSFLKILMTQLQNQDPMEPLQDSEFIAQMAQFTSVEQLMNMNDSLTLMRQSLGSASSLIGKSVEWYEYDEKGVSELKSAVVESIVLTGGKQYVKFSDDSMILADEVVSISDITSVNDDNDDSATDEGADTP